MSHPNVFVVTSGGFAIRPDDDDPDSGMPSRQDSLLPGQIRNPTMQPPTPFLDWARGESQLWESSDSTLNTLAAAAGGPAHGTGMQNGGGGGGDGNGGGGYDIWGSSDSNLGGGGGESHPFRQASSLFGDLETDGDDGQLAAQALAEAVVGTSMTTADYTRIGEHAAQRQQQRRDESAMLSAELHRHAQLCPPPPPFIAPMASRRARADLWHFHAAKWDITMRLPPPPRNPLAGMEEEHRMQLQALTKVPYRGDRWLARCEFWHHFVQSTFDYPPGSDIAPVAVQTIFEHCCLK